MSCPIRRQTGALRVACSSPTASASATDSTASLECGGYLGSAFNPLMVKRNPQDKDPLKNAPTHLLQMRGQLRVLAELVRERAHQRRFDAHQRSRDAGQALQARRQTGEVARPRRAQRHAREDAFEIDDVLERIAQALEAGRAAVVVEQRRDGVVAHRQLRRVAQRPRQPALQRARTHRGDAAVEHLEQREIVLAGQRAVDLQIAPRRRIENQRFAGCLDAQGSQVRQRGLLRFLQVLQQGTGGGDCRVLSLGTEAAQVLGLELFGQQAIGRSRIEVPDRPRPAVRGAAAGVVRGADRQQSGY